MKLPCSVCVCSRESTSTIYAKRKHVKSTIALCRYPNSEKYCLLLFSGQNKHGTKYMLKDNIVRILTKFVHEGKATIQMKSPPHDLFVQSDAIQMKSFLNLLRQAIQGTITTVSSEFSSMSVTPFQDKEILPKKLVIRSTTELHKSLPNSLQILIMSNLARRKLDSSVLRLRHLKVLDLSNNLLELLPQELCQLAHLNELILTENNLGVSTIHQWHWMAQPLANSLHTLNLNGNKLTYIPDEIVKLKNLTYLDLSDNELVVLTDGIGTLQKLQYLSLAHNRLTSLPGNCRNLRLESLDLSNNPFRPLQLKNNFTQPKYYCVSTLVELSARQVLRAHHFYDSTIVPYTVVKYLDHAKYCLCGGACFENYISWTQSLALDKITRSFRVSEDNVNFVPIDCVFCGYQCFYTYVRIRKPII